MNTPETDKFFATFADGEYAPSHAEYYARLQDLERERDEWKAKYIQQNKDLGCEQMDPNGTIWDHAATLQRERDEARAETIRWMSIAEGRGRTEDEPDTQAELAEAYAKLDRILKLTIHDDTFWAIEEIARISGGESDCSVCGGCFMIPGSEENDDVMNTPCPKCNDPETISNQ